MSIELSFHPLTVDRWEDFVSLFGERGACGGCWCMLWRLPRKQFESQKGKDKKLAMKATVDSGEAPGILAYHRSKAVGWFAIAPRATYVALSKSRMLQPVDDRPIIPFRLRNLDFHALFDRYRFSVVFSDLERLNTMDMRKIHGIL